jgi:hypothetical protein
MWVYPTSTPTQTAILLHKGAYPYNYRITYDTTSKFGFALGLGGNFVEIYSTSTYATNSWYHVVGTYNSSTGSKIYVNGTLIGSGTTVGTVTTNTAALYIGSYGGGAGYKYKGKLDEIAIFNETLDQSQVSTLYNSGNGVFYIAPSPTPTPSITMSNSAGITPSVTPTISVTPTPSPSNIPSYPSNVCSYYRFDEVSGTTVEDIVGSSEGTATAGVTRVTGKKNNAVLFDNSGDYVTCTSTTGVSFTSSFSISMWVYQTSSPGNNGGFIVHKENYPYNYRVTAIDTSNVEFVAAINGTYNSITSTYNGFTNNEWHHIVCVYSSSAGKKLYIDGTERASNSTTGTLTSGSQALWMGRYAGATGYEFIGRLDELAFFNKALSSTEVSNLYYGGIGIFQ